MYKAHASPILNLHLRILRSGRLALRALTFVFIVMAGLITIRTLNYNFEATQDILSTCGCSSLVAHVLMRAKNPMFIPHATIIARNSEFRGVCGRFAARLNMQIRRRMIQACVFMVVPGHSIGDQCTQLSDIMYVQSHQRATHAVQVSVRDLVMYRAITRVQSLQV